MIKEDGPCGEMGSASIARYVKQAEANPHISAILFIMDGPGGMVSGTATLADAIYNCSKPTLSLIDDGMACSAHQWVAAAADETWITHSTCVMGSIGVYTSLADIKGFYEEQGLKIHEIYADQSSLKNKDFREAMNGNYSLLKEKH